MVYDNGNEFILQLLTELDLSIEKEYYHRGWK